MASVSNRKVRWAEIGGGGTHSGPEVCTIRNTAGHSLSIHTGGSTPNKVCHLFSSHAIRRSSLLISLLFWTSNLKQNEA